MNSIAGMPGPPIALVYRPHDTVRLRVNLSLSFIVMSIFSVVMLYAQRIGTTQSFTTAVNDLPAVAIGFGAARMVVHRMPGSAINRAVLWLAMCAGVFLLVRTLTA